jgi:acyl-CoA reductase-like NAD-dependent aldehyde dehydrogenase
MSSWIYISISLRFAHISQISQLQRDKVLSYIQSGREEGARVIIGGNKWANSGEGFWIEPTIMADVTPNFKVVKEEVSHHPFRLGAKINTLP